MQTFFENVIFIIFISCLSMHSAQIFNFAWKSCQNIFCYLWKERYYKCIGLCSEWMIFSLYQTKLYFSLLQENKQQANLQCTYRNPCCCVYFVKVVILNKYYDVKTGCFLTRVLFLLWPGISWGSCLELNNYKHIKSSVKIQIALTWFLR